jgi:hypothetical protein
MWYFEEDKKLLYFISTNFTYRPNVAILSFNNTLISGKMEKNNIPVMSLYNGNIIPFLEKINDIGSIIIIENATRISSDTIKGIIGKFMTLIDNETRQLSFMMLFPLENNKFQKPYTHIFNKIQHLYMSATQEKDLNNVIFLDKSIMIGANAGRLETRVYKADESDIDRAFANNIKLSNFNTPSQIFLNDDNIRQWRWKSDINIKEILEKQKTLLEPSFSTIFNDGGDINEFLKKKCVVFISGPPTSGKSILCNRVESFLREIYKSINIEDAQFTILKSCNFKDTQDMIQLFGSRLLENTSHLFIVDTLEYNYKRNPYFKLINELPPDIKKQKCIRYFEIETDRKICEFLNKFKLQITKNIIKATPAYYYNNYYMQYRKPDFNIIYGKDGDLTVDFKYINYPLVLRHRPEIFYKYSSI